MRFRNLALVSLLSAMTLACSTDGKGTDVPAGEEVTPSLVPPDIGTELNGMDALPEPEAGGQETTEPPVPDTVELQSEVLQPDLADGTESSPDAPVESDESPCAPDCAGKQCGPDGCGGECGVCPPPENLCAGYLACVPETGQCELDPETVVTCPDNPDPCLDDVCNSNTGGCEPLPAQDGLPCDDSDDKTTDDQCLGGVCLGKKSLEFCEQYTDNFNSLQQFPPDHTTVDFEGIEKCNTCPCCNGDGTYPWGGPDVLGCMKCELEDYLVQWGITKVGGMMSTMVFCITGNEDAPMSNMVVFVGADLAPAPGKYAVQFDLTQGVLAFGMSSVPSASNSEPVITLRGYDAAGNQVGYDQFSYEGNPPSGCEGTNPVVSFFGFRACGGSPMVKIIAEYTNPNVTIDNLVFYPPLD